MRKILILLTLLFTVFSGHQLQAQCSDLFFSEYIEGSSSNKAIEVYNPGDTTVNLTAYVLYRYNNGSLTPTDSLFPQGTLAPGAVFVIGNASANAAILAQSDTLHTYTFYNGDDALSMINRNTGDTLDIIGEIGVDPGSSWIVGTGATANFTLIRNIAIQTGELDWAIGATQWDVFPIDMSDSLGAHTMTPCASTGPACSDDLFFSEYIEGSSSNKAMEIYNPMDTTVDLTNYVVYRYNNGSLTATDSLFPQGTLASGDVWVFANPSANPAILAQGDTTHTLTFYNGDDAVALINMGTGDTLDIIGEIGVDPGSGWTVGTGATNNFTLIRKIGVQKGETNWAIGATQWDVFPIDMVDSLGMHTMTPCAAITGPACTDDLFFSEYIEGSSSNKAMEIYNPMDTTVDLTNYVVYRYNNGSLTATDSLFPQGTLASDSVWVFANPSANAAILAQGDTTHTLTFYNGDDAIVLINRGTGDTLDIIGEVGIDPGSGWTVGTGATNNFTLVRKITVQQGETDWTIGATQWDVYPIDMSDSLGRHTMTPCSNSPSLAPTLAFGSSVLSVSEGAGSVNVMVNISNPDSVNATSVDVVVNIGASTATGGAVDYTYATTTVTFPAASSTPQMVSIVIVDDIIVEGDETIQLELQNPTNSATIVLGTSTVTINDNDFPTYPIATIASVDTNGVGDSLGVQCWIHGVVYGVNMRPGGLQFTIIDPTDGIGVFDFNAISGYSVVETDSIAILGTIGQFNGLLQIDPDSIILFNSGNALKTATPFTVAGEPQESDLVRFDNATLVDPTQWTGTGSGFNVDVTNGTDTIEVRIDADVDLYSMPAPVGTFYVCGLGGQFDSSSPYTSGYQLLPRYQADIKLAPVVDLGPDDSICSGGSLLLDAGAGPYSYLWSTTATTQTITVSASGTYSVQVTDTVLNVTASDTIVVTDLPNPTAFIGCTQLTSNSYDFRDSSANATSVAWDFGDGQTSTASNPNHVFGLSGTYMVTLIATNACGSDTTTKQVMVVVGIDPGFGVNGLVIYPNPTEGLFALRIQNVETGILDLRIVNVLGKEMMHTEYVVTNGEFDTSIQVELPAGIYFVQVRNGEKSDIQRLLIR
jgi:hypothetical protein